MATRSVIARLAENGAIEGRYVHNDGYPEHMMGALYELLRRDGYETVCRVLLDEHTGWSFLNAFQEEEETYGAHIEVRKYWGKFYNDAPDDPFITSFEEARECGAEYIYVIVADGNEPVEIRCYDPYDKNTVPRALHSEKVLCNHEYDSYCANCGVAS